MRAVGPGRPPARYGGAMLMIFSLALAAHDLAKATETEYVIRSWDRGDGVPATVINQIQRTPNGYLWLATQRGLVRFDGERFKLFDQANHPEFGAKRVNCVLADGAGGIWLGTAAGLFHQSNGKTGTANWDEFGSQLGTKALTAGEGDVVWGLSPSNEVFQIAGGKLAQRFAAPADQPLHSLIHEKQLGLLAASAHKAILLRDGRWQPLSQDLTAKIRPDLVCQCSTGGFWAAANREVTLLSEREGEWTVTRPASYRNAPQAAITALMEDHTGRLWAGTRDGAVYYLQMAGEGAARLADGAVAWHQVTTKRLRSLGPVSCLYEDSEGLVWVGTTGGYLHQIKRRVITRRSLPNSTPENTPHTVCATQDGAVWIGTDGAGAYCCRNGSVSHFGAEQGLANGTVIAMLEDRQRNLWVGTYGGLFRLEDGQFKRELGPHLDGQPVPALLRDQAGALWIGTVGAVLRKRGEKIDYYSLGGAYQDIEVRAIATGRRGQIWIGTRGAGLFRLKDESVERFTAFRHPRVHTLHSDNKGNLWVGTATRGLFRVAGRSVYNWTRADGLPSSWIHSILEDATGTLWLGSNEGIFGVTRQALMERARDKHSPVLTIQVAASEAERWSAGSGQPAAAKGPDGRLWFPAGYGVLSFDPAELLHPRPVLPVLVEEIQVDGVERALDPARPLQLYTGAKRLDVRYTIADLDSPGRLKFRYKLEGLDETWVDAGTQRSATYGPLAPGSYRFRVISAGSADVWTETANPLTIQVVPHMWETAWFRICCAVFALSIVGATALVIGRAKLHRKLERLEMQSVMEKERRRIAQDLHDDLGSGISEIMFLSELARQEQSNAPVRVPSQLADITQKARRMATAMDEIVWMVDPKNDSLPDLGSYLCDYAREFLCAANVGCRLDMAEALPNVPLTAQQRHNLFLAVKEALNNAVKHSEADEVWLRIHWSAGKAELSVTIEDNGHGFNPAAAAQAASGNGLVNMRSRLEALGGRTEFVSESGQGTRVCFTLPLPGDAQT